LIDWVFNGMSTNNGKIVPTAWGGKLAQATKDGRRDTIRYTDTQ